MPNIRSAIKDTVPISLFDRGFAGKIFKEVKETGAALSEAEMNARLGIPKDALTDAEKVEFE